MNFTKLFVGTLALSAMLVACVDDRTSAKDTDRSEEVYSDLVVETNATTKTLIDLRDGQTYKTVKIGEQVWMAENLNYADSVKTPSLKGKSWCYDGVAGYCEKYGRLYTWAAAKTVCPEGWHLPSYDEWNTLFTAVGGIFTAGAKLKSQTGWTAYDGITNEDAFGFSALPAGYRNYHGNYNYEGSYAYFWSSTEYDSNHAYRMLLDYSYDGAYLFNYTKDVGPSVRCVKD